MNFGIFLQRFIYICLLVFNMNLLACNIHVPENLSACSSKLQSLLDDRSACCQEIGKAMTAFLGSANISSETLCEDIQEIASIHLRCHPYRSFGDVINLCGIAGFGYIALRGLVKQFVPSIRIEECIQSGLQKILSNPITLNVATTLGFASFINLLIETPTAYLVTTSITGVIPTAVGAFQFLFDCQKIFRFCLKQCGCCLPSKEETAKKRQLTIDHCNNEISRYQNMLQELG